jgi:Acetyltransferase (GNAT) family
LKSTAQENFPQGSKEKFENIEERLELKGNQIYFDGTRIGVLALSDHESYYSVGFITIPEEYRGKGIGTFIYKKLATSLDKPLRSDLQLSELGENLWKKFECEGLAERIDTAPNGRGIYEWRG